MLNVEEAIRKRRSIRKFKPDVVPDELVDKVLEAARLAPSGSNRQPWRFQVIREAALKERLYQDATFNQAHVAQAPVVIVCGAELLTYVKGHKLAPPGADYFGADSEDWEELSRFVPDARENTAIAVEHMMLMATALGLGSCWVQRIKYGQVAKVLGWPRHLTVFALMLLGYSDEDPPLRPRMAREQMILPGALAG